MEINSKFFVISENLILENNQKWIIDSFTNEFREFSGLHFADNLDDANVIWILGYNIDIINKIKNPEQKKIITTIHHINFSRNKFIEFKKFFDIVDKITTYYHAICPKIEKDLKKLTTKEIRVANFWINDNIFFNINERSSLRRKYLIPENKYIIGSFQRDTEGKHNIRPKLSKGPDIFIQIILNIKLLGKEPFIILTGRRREYVIKNLVDNNIPYLYKEMVSFNELNELYNCLDLYIVSSRVEGGPRSILECGIAKIPLISTDVGIAELILSKESIYDVNNYLSYINAYPNIEYAYNNACKYKIKEYIKEFCYKIFS